MDTTGYGRSTRPAPMNDPCNLSRGAAEAVRSGADRRAVRADVSRAAHDHCAPTGTTSTAWSTTSAPCARWRRSAWWPGRSADRAPAAMPRSIRRRCSRLVLLAPAYNRDAAAAAPALPRAGRRLQHAIAQPSSTRTGIGRSAATDQFDPSVRDAVWADMIASDPVGATWGAGVRRAPSTTTLGIQHGDGRRHEDADADDRRRARQAGDARARARRSTTISVRATRC